MCIAGWLTNGGTPLVQAPPFVNQSLSRPQQGVDRVKQKLAETRLGHQPEVPHLCCNLTLCLLTHFLFTRDVDEF